MKKLLTTFLLLALSAAAAAQTTACLEHFANKAAPELTRPALQKKTIGLCFEAFALMHSGVSRTPLWVAEKLTRESLIRARSVQREDNFHAEETLPPEDRAELHDYARSGFDRGHMAPAADMPSLTAQHESFSLANIVPQQRQNNQILWAAIEGATRHMTNLRGELYVMTGPIFEGEKIERINGRVFIPTHIYKAVYDPAKKEGAAWISPNTAENIYEVVSIAELEKRININLFPGIPADAKDKIASLPEPRMRKRQRNPSEAP
jgi:endonuclease G, mitochondrial